MGSIQTEIIVLDFFCVIVSLFIIGLLIQRARHSRAQEASSKSEERYLLALESSTDGLWDWNILSDTVHYSDRFREILGYSPAEFPGTMESFRSRLHPDEADAIWKTIERHLKERIPFIVEFRLLTKSGIYLLFLSCGQAIWDATGNAVRMSGWIQDISDRKQAELNLQAALSEIKEFKRPA